MIYKEMRGMEGATHNFKIYRVVRLLHNLKVIKDAELIRHEEAIYDTKVVGLHIDWEKYQLIGGPGEVIQF